MGNTVILPTFLLSLEKIFYSRDPRIGMINCLTAATLPRPQTYWQAITEANLMYMPSDTFISDSLVIDSALSAERYSSANWTQTGLQYRDYLHARGKDLSDLAPFMNNLQVASFAFVVSTIFRVMQIISTNFLNKIDTLKWNAPAKLLASSAAIALPYLVIEYVCGWSTMGLMFISLVQNFLIFGLTHFNMGWSNTIRELNVLSQTRNFNFFDIFSRGFLSSTINFLSSTCLNTAIFSIIPKSAALTDNEASLLVCEKHYFTMGKATIETLSVGISQKDAIFAKYFTNELGWLLGRYVVDLYVSALHTIGLIKDLRDPFGLLEGKPEKPPIILQRPQLAESHPKSLATASAAPPPAKMKSGEEGAKTSDYRAEYAVAAPAEKPKKTPSGIRKALAARPSSAAHEVTSAPEPAIIRPDTIAIPSCNDPMVKLHGKVINHDTYGVVICDRISGLKSFITALQTGHVAKGASIKFLENKIFEIRPTNTGDRLIGKEEDFDKTAKRLLPLGAAIEFDRTHNPDGTLKAVPFTTRVKHERITQGIAAASKEL